MIPPVGGEGHEPGSQVIRADEKRGGGDERDQPDDAPTRVRRPLRRHVHERELKAAEHDQRVDHRGAEEVLRPLPRSRQSRARAIHLQRDADDREPHRQPEIHREVHRHERPDAEYDERGQDIEVLAVRAEVGGDHRSLLRALPVFLCEVLLRFKLVGLRRERGAARRPRGPPREHLHLIASLHHRLELLPRVASRSLDDVAPILSAHLAAGEDHGVDAPAPVRRREEELSQRTRGGEELL